MKRCRARRFMVSFRLLGLIDIPKVICTLLNPIKGVDNAWNAASRRPGFNKRTTSPRPT